MDRWDLRGSRRKEKTHDRKWEAFLRYFLAVEVGFKSAFKASLKKLPPSSESFFFSSDFS